MPPSLRQQSSFRHPSHVRGGSQSDVPLLSIDQSMDKLSILTPPSTAGFNPDFTIPPLTGRLFAEDDISPEEGIPLKDSYLDLNWCLFILTLSSCIVTTYYAYNATLENPDIKFIPMDPDRMIGILNALSAVSAFLLGELVQAVFERIRWILASRPKGVALTDFLGMSRATSITGVVALLCWGKRKQSPGVFGISRGNKKMWILQRIFIFLLFGGLRLILLGEPLLETANSS